MPVASVCLTVPRHSSPSPASHLSSAAASRFSPKTLGFVKLRCIPKVKWSLEVDLQLRVLKNCIRLQMHDPGSAEDDEEERARAEKAAEDNNLKKGKRIKVDIAYEKIEEVEVEAVSANGTTRGVRLYMHEGVQSAGGGYILSSSVCFFFHNQKKGAGKAGVEDLETLVQALEEREVLILSDQKESAANTGTDGSDDDGDIRDDRRQAVGQLDNAMAAQEAMVQDESMQAAHAKFSNLLRERFEFKRLNGPQSGQGNLVESEIGDILVPSSQPIRVARSNVDDSDEEESRLASVFGRESEEESLKKRHESSVQQGERSAKKARLMQSEEEKELTRCLGTLSTIIVQNWQKACQQIGDMAKHFQEKLWQDLECELDSDSSRGRLRAALLKQSGDCMEHHGKRCQEKLTEWQKECGRIEGLLQKARSAIDEQQAQLSYMAHPIIDAAPSKQT